jgi:cyclophilin family peptidyl-prolyl cis-trans isomerase
MIRKVPVALLTALAISSGCGESSTADDIDAAPIVIDAEAGNPVVVMETALGNLAVELYPEYMPITTANFLAYVDAGFYDGTLVHRVVDDWVIQGGGYSSGMTAKPANPPIVLETSDQVSHIHGAISMARTNDPDSATSQWFICDWPDSGTAPQPAQLDGSYAAFGVVVQGLDTLAAIAAVNTSSQAGLDDVPVTEIVLTSAYRQ